MREGWALGEYAVVYRSVQSGFWFGGVGFFWGGGTLLGWKFPVVSLDLDLEGTGGGGGGGKLPSFRTSLLFWISLIDVEYQTGPTVQALSILGISLDC